MALYLSKYEFKHVYDVKTLDDYIRYAERDIQRCIEAIDDMRKYIEGLQEQKEKVESTSYENVVHLERRQNYSTHRIEFYVNLEKRPIVEERVVNGRFVYGEFSHNKRFEGKERHLAIAYAHKLARENEAKIEKKGFGNR
jgi:hypothetical protein